MRRTIFGLAMIALFAVVGHGRATNLVDLTAVPPAVMKTAKEVTTDATWTSAETWKEDGEVIYRVNGTNAKKLAVSVMTKADGSEPVVTTNISLTDVPATVKKALKDKQVFFEAKSVKTFGVDDREVISYQFKGETIGGVPQSVLVYAKSLRVVVDE